MNEDTALLRAYVEQQVEDAFARLVHRHIELVYATSLRRVGLDTHLAEDVTQAVFADLARKAASLVGHASLAGWLYVSAQRASAAAVRRERRRKARELTAQSMQNTDTSPASSVDPGTLRPVIDDAIATLRRDEREAVVLRYFEQRSFAEIGAVLRLNEDAARKRVDRALDKLQAVLVRRGITSTSVALGAALTAAGAVSIPGGLADKVAGAAVAQAGAVSTVATIASALWPAAAVLAVGAFLVFPSHRVHEALAAETAQLSAANLAIPSLRVENRRLARTIAEARELEGAPAAVSALRAARAAAPVASPPAPNPPAVTITTEGAILWKGEYITLAEYLANMAALRTAARDGESRLVIHAPGARFQQMIWAFDEARKAGIRHIIVESDAKPEPLAPFAWF